jgi:lipopolysaccharide export system protein LptC
MPSFSTRALFPFFTLLAIAVVGWRLLSGHSEQPPPALHGEEARSDYYVAGARLTRTDAQGRPAYEITAARMIHRPDRDGWLLESPTMEVFADVGEPWYGRAERGRIWADGEQAKLLGDVRLWRPASAHNRPVTIDTRDVYLRPQRKYAETAAAVVVQQQRNRLEGIGARIYLDEERYQLLSEVRGRYVP